MDREHSTCKQRERENGRPHWLSILNDPFLLHDKAIQRQKRKSNQDRTMITHRTLEHRLQKH